MKLEKRTARLLAGASILLVVILALPSRRSSVEPTSPAPAPPLAGPPQVATEPDDGARLLAQRQRARELTWTRDPFAPPATRTSAPFPSTEPVPALESLQGPVLTGVSLCDDARRAVIDRRIVQEGDRLPSGYTVARITARSVTLLRDQEELTLCLGEER